MSGEIPSSDPIAHGRDLAGAAGVGYAAPVIGTVPDPSDLPRPSANSAAEAKRSAGIFSSARSTTASSSGVTLGRAGRIGRTRSVTTFAMIACAVEPVWGGSPVSISWSTAASA